MRTHLAWLLLVLVVGSLCLLWHDTARLLLATNTNLQAQVMLLQNAPHPVHDASITAWHEPDGSILIVVNGRFKHRVTSPWNGQRCL